MLFLLNLFSPNHWEWKPEFTPDTPLHPLLKWIACALLTYLAVYLVFLMQAPIRGVMNLIFS